MADAKMLMNLPKGTRIFRNSMTERIMNNGFSGNNMMTADENNQLKKLGGFNGLSDYTDSKFGGGINYSSVKADNITVNITNTYGNQSPAQIKDTNNDLVRKINDVLFQKEDRKKEGKYWIRNWMCIIRKKEIHGIKLLITCIMTNFCISILCWQMSCLLI